MSRLYRIVLATLVLLASISIFADSGLVGQWQLRIEGRMGIQTPTLTVQATDGIYSGSIGGARGQLAINTIAITGNQFTFPFKMTTPMGEFNLIYSGTRDGDLLTGTVQTPRGPIPLTGVRKTP